MAISRRSFIQLGFKTAVVISGANVLQSFAAGNFVLPHQNDIALRFAVASDGHYGQLNTDYDGMHNEMLQWLNAEKRQRGLAFTMINGDLIHDDASMLPMLKAHWDKLDMPYYVSHGNHDKTTEPVWEKTWNTKWHYSFEQGNATFLVLNTADITGKYICPDLEWTKAALEKYASKELLFVFMHITPVKWTQNGIDCPELTGLFSKQQNLKAVFHGHDHDQDNVKEHEGKHYFFDAHIAGNWGTDYRGYRIVEILKDGKIVSYQMNPQEEKMVNNSNI